MTHGPDNRVENTPHVPTDPVSVDTRFDDYGRGGSLHAIPTDPASVEKGLTTALRATAVTKPISTGTGPVGQSNERIVARAAEGLP